MLPATAHPFTTRTAISTRRAAAAAPPAAPRTGRLCAGISAPQRAATRPARRAAAGALPGAHATHGTALELIQAAVRGELSAADAAASLSAYASGVAQVGAVARLDAHRASRAGFPGVVWAPGKQPEQIAQIMGALAATQHAVLATRVEPETYAAVRRHLPGVEYHGAARTLTLRSEGSDAPRTPRLPGSVAVVTAGTADLAVAEECRVVAEHMGAYVFKVRACAQLFKHLKCAPPVAAVGTAGARRRRPRALLAARCARPPVARSSSLPLPPTDERALFPFSSLSLPLDRR
jgi:hypothetical protein